ARATSTCASRVAISSRRSTKRPPGCCPGSSAADAGPHRKALSPADRETTTATTARLSACGHRRTAAPGGRRGFARRALVRLPPVEVKAVAPLPETLPRPSVPSSLDIVSPEEVRASRPRVLPDALERLPGVTPINVLAGLRYSF